LAEGYVAAGDLAMARYYYENAARFGALDADARHNLARIYLLAGEYDKAYEHIWWLLLRGDQSRINLVLLGEYYLRTGAYPEAEQYLVSYLEEFPRSTHGQYLLGRVYVMTGNYNLAREYFARAVAEDSSSSELYYGIACLESLDGQSDRSLAALKTAFENGLSARNLQEDERCLARMLGDVRLREMIRQAVGE
jgi:tetratricopeptide (TPR) repeat protein